MPFDQQCVLVYGKYQVLLGTRKHLLQRAGHAVLATSEEWVVSESLASGNVSVLVLCHSLTMRETETVLRVYDKVRCSAAILSMSTVTRQRTTVGNQVFDAHTGPAAFLEAVRTLTASHVFHFAI